jgi:DNA invertase Pin-like site-specific DNA recombinase
MLANFAEFEREILRERVKAGIAQARKEGRPQILSVQCPLLQGVAPSGARNAPPSEAA